MPRRSATILDETERPDRLWPARLRGRHVGCRSNTGARRRASCRAAVRRGGFSQDFGSPSAARSGSSDTKKRATRHRPSPSRPRCAASTMTSSSPIAPSWSWAWPSFAPASCRPKHSSWRSGTALRPRESPALRPIAPNGRARAARPASSPIPTDRPPLDSVAVAEHAQPAPLDPSVDAVRRFRRFFPAG